MSELSSLPNVGKVLEKLLIASGITTAEQLREVGTEDAFIRVRLQDPTATACVQMLYGIEGAVEGIRDTLLAPSTKERLKQFYKIYKCISVQTHELMRPKLGRINRRV